jgi:hypothetical protein
MLAVSAPAPARTQRSLLLNENAVHGPLVDSAAVHDGSNDQQCADNKDAARFCENRLYTRHARGGTRRASRTVATEVKAICGATDQSHQKRQQALRVHANPMDGSAGRRDGELQAGK